MSFLFCLRFLPQAVDRLFKVDGVDLVVLLRRVPSVQDSHQGRLRDHDVGQVPALQLHDVPDELAGGKVPKFDVAFAAGRDHEGLSDGHATDLTLQKCSVDRGYVKDPLNKSISITVERLGQMTRPLGLYWL